MRENEEPTQALERMLNELEQHRARIGDACVAHHRDVHSSVTSTLRNVPLIHGVNNPASFRAVVEAQELRPRAALGMPRLPAEDYFQMRDVVYTAAGILYPDRAFALVLNPSVEDVRLANASPWDSASFYRTLCRHLPPAANSRTRLELFLANTLPAPQYRRYLVDYVATHYATGSAYLGLESPTFADPIEAFCESFTSRVFEVRFETNLPISTWSIDMIFVPRDVGGRESLTLRRLLEPFSKKNKVQRYEGSSDTLQSRARRWLLDRLGRARGAA